MTGRLIIDELHATRFGGLTNTGLSLAGHDMVVVHGGNESGKTTFATLLAWLLVGPTGTAPESLRFGKPGDQLDGRLTGTLNGQALRLDATFKLLQRGLPNSGGIAAQHAGHKLDINAWRTTIAGIDPKVLTTTYRMWGADLHSDDGVLDAVTQAALDGFGGTKRISDVVASLQKLAQEYLTGRAEGVESFSTLGVQRSTIEAEIKALGANADNYRQLDHEVSQVAEQLQASRVRANELSATVAGINALRSVTQERNRTDRITADLAVVATVPDEWMPLAAEVDKFTEIAKVANQAAQTVRTEAEKLREAAAQAGLDDAQANTLRVSHATVTSVQVTLNQLDAARTAAKAASDAMRRAEHAAATASAEANRAFTACPEAQPDAFTARPLTEIDLRGLRTAINEWATAERQVASALADTSTAQTRVDVATGICDSARSRWDRFGTGSTAQQWRANPAPVAPVAPVTTAASTGRPWLVVALAGVIALAAVLVLPRWAAVGVTAAAFAGVVWTVRRTRPLTDASAVSVVPVSQDSAMDAELLEAANAVMAAELGLDQARGDLQRQQAELDRLQRAIDQPRSTVNSECMRLNLAVAPTPAAATDMADRALVASAAVMAKADAEQELITAQRRLDETQHDVITVQAELCTTLANVGVPESLPCEQTAASIEALRHLTDLAAQHHRLERAAHDAQQAFDTLIAPLGAAAAERSQAWLVAEAARFAELLTTRLELTAERNDLNHDINTRFREHRIAAELAAQHRTDGEWAAELDLRQAELAEAEENRDDLNRRLGELRQTMDQLMSSNELTNKRLQLGMVTERADEQLLAGVVAVAARTLLARTAAEYRRTRQPEVVDKAGSLLSSVATDWKQLLVDPTENGSAEITVVDAAGAELAATRLSTGARALTYLALRLATADLDAKRRRLRFPIICDDPLVHLDDDRALAVMPLLARAAADGHQVIVFTCHGRTVDAARAVGAHVVQLD